MNKQTVQSEINRIVEEHRASDYNHGNRQYPASKKYLAQAEELGILEFIPNMPFKQQIGNTEIQLILKEAMQSGGTETFTTTEGEGDDVTVSASALFTAINEINMEKPAMKIRKGATVRVLPHTTYQHLVLNAVVSNPIEHQHNGYKSVTVTNVIDDGMERYSVEIETAGGMVDYIPSEYVELTTGE